MSARNLKVLFLTRYTERGASSRMRMFQFRDRLMRAGLAPTFLSLLNDEYLDRLYAKKPTGTSAARCMIRQAARLFQTARPDVIVIEKEVFPYLPWFVERALLPRGVPFIADYDDAVFHGYDMNPRRAVRALLGSKIDKVMSNSALVIAGNDYLAERAHKAGAHRCEVIPTAVDATRFHPADLQRETHVPVVGWIGSPSTAIYLEQIIQPVRRLVQGQKVKTLIVGARMADEETDPFHFVPWSMQTEVGQVQAMDIGIMPLTDDPWSRGKCGYKLLQYMACGLPVVASPVGVNRAIVEHGVNGFLADSPEEWFRSLAMLAESPELRHRMGKAGREKVMAEFDVSVVGDRLINAIRSVTMPERRQ